MSAIIRTPKVDRRRLKASDRQIYNPSKRLNAIARTKAYKGFISQRLKQKPFATERRPGTGGFTGGLFQQQQRLADKGDARRRSESFRPEMFTDEQIRSLYSD